MAFLKGQKPKERSGLLHQYRNERITPRKEMKLLGGKGEKKGQMETHPSKLLFRGTQNLPKEHPFRCQTPREGGKPKRFFTGITVGKGKGGGGKRRIYTFKVLGDLGNKNRSGRKINEGDLAYKISKGSEKDN